MIFEIYLKNQDCILTDGYVMSPNELWIECISKDGKKYNIPISSIDYIKKEDLKLDD